MPTKLNQKLLGGFMALSALTTSSVAFAQSEVKQDGKPKNYTLIISGANDLAVIIKNLEDTYKTEKQSGHKIFLVGGNGEFDFTNKDDQVFPARTEEDVEKAIQALGKQMKPGDTLNLFGLDHGGWATDPKDPLTASIVLDPGRLSTNVSFLLGGKLPFNRLLAFLKTSLPAEAPVRMISVMCFGGGIHHVSQALSHGCSASQTDYQTVATTGLGEEYLESFLKRGFSTNGPWGLHVVPSASLYEAHLAGILKDDANSNQSLSSEDYVDQILKEGLYSEHPSPPQPKQFASTVAGTFARMAQFQLPLYFRTQTQDLSQYCQKYKKYESFSDLNRFLGETETLIDGSQPNKTETLLSEEDKQILETVMKARAKFLKKNQGICSGQVREILHLSKAGQELIKEWNSLSAFKKLTSRADYTTKFLLAQSALESKEIELARGLRIREFIKKESEFLVKATDEQRKKYFNLLKCELMPL